MRVMPRAPLLLPLKEPVGTTVEEDEEELDELFGVEETPAGVEEGLELDAKIDENRLWN